MVAASMKKNIDGQIPNYPNLPSKLLCILNNVTLHADTETDEVYAQMTLQPVPSYDKEALLRSDLVQKSNKPHTEFFCKTLTASDTSTHGGFSVPRRAAEKIFPPLDFSMQSPVQEIVAKDLHDEVWTFRHIFRGHPKRHLFTTGWSLFVSRKRVSAGDSVLFIRDEKQQLLLGIRRANRQSNNLSSSVLSSDSMHIGILAAAANAAANNSPFTVFYNPKASPSEFVIPLAKYFKTVYCNQISLGLRFRMMFETEESGTRRYMGTITGISDLDPVRWKNSQWRNLQVGWDESTAGERCNRVSIWEIEPLTAPFFLSPPPLFRFKHPRQADDDASDLDNIFKRTMSWIGNDFGVKDSQASPGLSLVQWMNMMQNPSLANTMESSYMHSFPGSILQSLNEADLSSQLPQITKQNNLHFVGQSLPQQVQQIDQLPKLPSNMNPLGSIISPQKPLGDISQQSRQHMTTQALPSGQIQAQILQPQNLSNVLQRQSSIQSPQLPVNLPQNTLPQRQQQEKLVVGQNQQQNLVQSQIPDQRNQNFKMSDKQVQLQLLLKLQQQRQSLLAQQSALPQPAQLTQLQDEQRLRLDASQNFSRSEQRLLLDESQNFSRSVLPTQILEIPQVTPTSFPQSNIISQQIAKSSGLNNVLFSHPSQPPKFEQMQPDLLPQIRGHLGHLPSRLNTQVSNVLTGAAGVGQSVITDDNPSCSISPSTNNCQCLIQQTVHSQVLRRAGIGEDVVPSASALLSPSALETMPSDTSLVKDFPNKSNVKPSVNISKTQDQVFFTPQAYLNGGATQSDYLDTSSSTTSVCLSQNDVRIRQNNNLLSYNPQSMLRDFSQDGEVQADPRCNVPYVTNIDGSLGSMNPDPLLTKGLMGLGQDFCNTLSSAEMLFNYKISKDAQQELSSSIVSQSFGVPDIALDSIESTVNNNSSFLESGPWAPPPQFPQRMRTYTKVYKRGAVGRSIDITQYSGYDELKQDLARRFGIEGQLEDRGRIGWKLVYVDHENDVLLVGDDPWEEFVNCVRCIKILSPQEVQQMSLDGDFRNSELPNQACSSSNNEDALSLPKC